MESVGLHLSRTLLHSCIQHLRRRCRFAAAPPSAATAAAAPPTTATNEALNGAITFSAGAAVFTLDAGAGQQLNFTHGAVTRNAGATLLLRADGLGSAAGADVATIKGSAATYAFVGQLGGTGTTNKGVLPWAIGDSSLTGAGVGFLTGDSAVAGANAGTNILRLLSASEQTSSLTASQNLALGAAKSYTSDFKAANPLSINSLQLNSGGSLEMIGGIALTIDSGGILALSGNSGVTNGSALLTTPSNREVIVHAAGDILLAPSIVGTSGGLTKSGPGILTLSSSNNTFTGTVTLLQGGLKLSGSDQTILPNQTLQLMGGSLDLFGAVQHFNNLQAQSYNLAVSDVPTSGVGGQVINTGATPATLALATGNVNFNGRIGNDTPSQSNISVVRGQAANSFQDWNLYGDNTFTGKALLAGGRTQMVENGRLSGLASLEISNGSVLFGANNQGVQAVSSTLDRLKNDAAIVLRGGMLQFRAIAAQTYTETIGAITLQEGASIIDIVEPGTNFNQYDVTAASMARTDGSRATLRFMGIDGAVYQKARLFFSSAPTLTNRLIGGWAVFETEFASYTSGMGVGGLSTAGYAGYDTAIIHNAVTTDNVRIGTIGATTLSADRDINSLAIVVAGATTLDLGGKLLTLRSGGLIAANATDSTAITIQNGTITAGTLNVGGDLYVHALSYNSGSDIVARDVVISATIANNGTGPVSLVIDGTDGRGSGQGRSKTLISGANTYSGGTFVNAGRVLFNVSGANGTTVTAAGSGNLTISGGSNVNGNNITEFTTVAELGSAGQISSGATVTLNGGAIFDLGGNTQTVAGLNFNNTGGNGSVVSFAGGTLVLGGNVSASGWNIGTTSVLGGTLRSGRANASTTTLYVSSTAGLAAGMTVVGGNVNTTISSITDANTVVLAGNTGTTAATSLISFGSSGVLSLGGSTRTFAIDDVKWNGAVLNPYLAQLNVTAVVTGTGSEGLTKTGNGLLQLSAQNTFTGGVTVSSGGLIIGASTNVTTRDAATAEPAAFVSGPIGTGTLTMASGTRLLASAANTINNAYTIGTTLTFAGTNALTLNAPTTLVGNTTITVDEPMVTLTLNGIIGEAGSGYSLTKQGLGTLLLGGNNTFTGGVTVNAGTLALAGLNAGSTAPIYAGTTATIGNNGMLALLNSGTGSNGIISYAGKIAVSGSLSFANISVGNNGANTGNTVQLDELLLNGGQTLNVTSANSYVLRILNLTGDTADGTAPQLNVASGSTAVVFSYTGDKPVNVGLGSLVFPDLVYAATSTTLAANPVVLSGSYPMSVQNSVIPLATDISTFGHAAGGLSVLASAPTAAVASGGAGVGYSASGVLTTRLADGAFGTRPVVVPGTGANTLATYSGLLKITTAGSYVFRSGTDDGGTLFIDGSGVLSDGTFGHAFTDIPAVTIPLTAGYHFISYKFANSSTTAGGGYRLLYSGADTSGFQTVGGSNVFAATGAPTAANLYNGAAIVNNDYSVAASTTATIDTFGSVFGVVIDASKTFTLGNGAVLNILNGTNGSFGNGYFGSAAPTSIGTGVILATTNTATAGAGSLNLIGAVTQSGATLTTGVGATTALIKAGQGTLSLGADNSATFSGLLVVQGGTVVLNNAKALSTGTTGTLIANNGTATAITGTTAVGSASITASTTTTLQPGMAVTGTGIPTGAYIVSVDSATAFTLSQAATAPGTGVSLTPATSGMLDLNGLTGVTGNVTINGAGSSLLSSSARRARSP